MKRCFADTNFYLRFILQDNKTQANLVEEELKRAKAGQIQIIFLSIVILEMGFVLKSFYSIPNVQITTHLSTLIKTSFLEVQDRSVWLKVLPVFAKKNIDLIDIFLFEKAISEDGTVLSFDKDLERLKKLG